MELLDDDCSYLDYLDSILVDQNTCSDLFWSNPSGSVGNDLSSSEFVPQEQENTRKRARNDSCRKPGSKACREKLRRERLNDRFLDLSSILEPGRPAKSDKPAILDDAIRVLNQLRTEAQELKETNEKLQEEIKSLKAEKNELREEKLILKADKEKIEQQLKAMAHSTAAFMPAHPAAYHAGMNKMAVFPSYGLIPMYQYLPQSSRDTSRDHELRPPAA
ncbi:transcription factor bHLH104-like isoform X1 [Mangifera indica]|uniref:transcription factor bHLH104-like isoform X1 n=1 Tax=Mangifera indica TaxID=29780 RepID=UPI001CFB2B65|nr:transcription factor bHLH104-like isoform X1 [Mangifera indica]